MSFTFESDDGVVNLKKTVVRKDFLTLQKGCPRQGSTCSFKILCISNYSTGQTSNEKGIPLALSRYCPDPSSTTFTEPITATIGVTSTSEFDRLLDVCLTRLHVGEEVEVKMKCFRSKSSYTLAVELVSLEDLPELYDLSPEKIYELASALKDEGVQLFTNGFVVDAFYKFSQAMTYFHPLAPPTRESNHTALISTLQNNLTSCHIKVGNWEDAIDLCNEVLDIDPTNVKALYRRGWSYIETQEYEKANVDLLKAQQLDPDNKAINIKLKTLRDKEKALNTKYAQAMKKFFS